jgi:hypothetical protein
MPRSKATDDDLEIGPAEVPGAPGPIPNPDHRPDIPAAPATHPPEAMIVPSDPAIGEFWSTYGPTVILVLVGLFIGVLIYFSRPV